MSSYRKMYSHAYLTHTEKVILNKHKKDVDIFFLQLAQRKLSFWYVCEKTRFCIL